ncbi:hypothetical protein Tco_1121308 [Tanacetum coccineum]|uniref:Uncharacterized protein n=1 Tax=Tanacetum coccineum TaxID=301880 RepID=A0ABQ5J093_9ASTR
MGRTYCSKLKQGSRRTNTCSTQDSPKSSSITSCHKINQSKKKQSGLAQAKDDPILTTMRFIPLHEGSSKELKAIPKPKYVHRSTKVKPEQAPKASFGKRLKATAKVTKSGKKKQPAKGLETLSEIALSEAEQMKLAIERRVPDVPIYGSDEEKISWKSSDEDDEENIGKDEDDNDQDDDE